MGVSKNKGTPKWMVYNGKPYEQMDDLGGPSLFLETSISTYLKKTLRNNQCAFKSFNVRFFTIKTNP